MPAGARSLLPLTLAGIALYVALGLFVLPDGPWGDVKQGPLVVLVCLFPLLGSVIVRRLRTGESYPAAWRQTVTRRSLLSLAAFALASQVFFAAFMAWKAHLPAWGHFWADPGLAQLDAEVHGGRDVWLLLQPLTTTAAGLWSLDLIYHCWLPALCLMLGWRAWAEDYRFFLAFALCWIVLGTAVALAAHSGGPIFYRELAGGDRYAALMGQLEALPGLRTHETKSSLWNAYAEGYPSSISAFPSMHLAIVTLYALACPRGLPWLAGALWIFAGLMAVAAVGLGWHYAVDVYAGALGAYGCWWLAGRLSA